MGFVGNYAPCGLSPQTDGMPIIRQNKLHINVQLIIKSKKSAKTQAAGYASVLKSMPIE